MPQKRASVVLLIAVALAAAGCGGSSAEPEVIGVSQTKTNASLAACLRSKGVHVWGAHDKNKPKYIASYLVEERDLLVAYWDDAHWQAFAGSDKNGKYYRQGVSSGVALISQQSRRGFSTLAVS